VDPKKQAQFDELKARLDAEYRIEEYRARLDGLKSYLGINEEKSIPLSLFEVMATEGPARESNRPTSHPQNVTELVKKALSTFSSPYTIKEVCEVLVRRGQRIDSEVVSKILWRLKTQKFIEEIAKGGKEGNTYRNL
jgi:hypothetical protein